MIEPTWGMIILYAVYVVCFSIAVTILLSYLPCDVPATKRERIVHSRDFHFELAPTRRERSGYEWIGEIERW